MVENSNVVKSIVHSDMVYQENMNELRHHRNMEIITANWNSIIMLAIIGGEITIKTELEKGELTFLTPTSLSNIKILIAFLITILTFSALYSIYYSHNRYVLLREYNREYFEQEVQISGLIYVETHEKNINKLLKQYIFLMIGSALLGITAFIILLV